MLKIKTSRTIVAFCSVTALVGGFNAIGCSSSDTDASHASLGGNDGTLGLALQLDPGTTLDTVSYTITGPNAFMKTGTIDVSGSTSITATISPIPVATGYSIGLTATSAEGNASCSGSATFDITAGHTTPANVRLICRETAHTGSVLVNGVLNVCAIPDGIDATPSEVLVGSTIELTGHAHDLDSGPSPLTYQWIASSGTLSDPASPNPVFTCTTAGLVTLTMSVSDGDPSPTCNDSVTATVSCSTAGGSGGATGSGGTTSTGGTTSACPGYTTNDDCSKCICMKCASQVSQCFQSSDSTKNMQCAAIQNCAQQNHCASTPCYCGANNAACLIPNGPCLSEINTASNNGGPLVVQQQSTDTTTAVGRANAIGMCSESNCKSECGLM